MRAFQDNVSLSFFRSLRGRLILLLLAISLIPLTGVGWLAYYQGQQLLHEEINNKLALARDNAAHEIENFFMRRKQDAQVISGLPYVGDASRLFLDALAKGESLPDKDTQQTMRSYRALYQGRPELDDARDQSAYSQAHARYHGYFRNLQKFYGYYDVFLIEPDTGVIFYSARKESDFGTSLRQGEYAGTGLADVFAAAVASDNADFVKLSDFTVYGPSGEPAAFIASPVMRDGKMLAVLAFQLPTQRINEIMKEASLSGMGKTGESYLVGPDKLMRSDSRLNAQSTLLRQKVDTLQAGKALAGESGVMISQDYRDESVLAAYAPFNIQGLHWAVLSEIDMHEAFAPVQKLLWLIGLVVVVAALTVVAIAFYFGNSIARPVRLIAEAARGLAAGDLSQDIEIQRGDEIGQMAAAFRDTLASLRRVVGELGRVAGDLAGGQLSSRVQSDFPGELAGIKQSTNAIAANIQEIIAKTNHTLAQLAGGNMAVRVETDFPGDFSEVKRALNGMAGDLQGVIGETSKNLARLAAGDMQLKITREFLGDFAEIKDALETTARKLDEATTQNNTQNWLKSGQSQLAEQTGGDKNIVQLAEDIINFLTPYLSAQVGAFYLWHPGATEEAGPSTGSGTGYLKMLASHAYVRRKNATTEFRLGESMVGQAALERKLFVVAHAPDDYVPIQSGLGESAPRNILVAPFIHEGELKGVLELASFEIFSDIQMDFLNQVLASIALAVNTAESRTKMKVLLEQTQAQSEELQQQQAALQQSNEELQSQSEELQAQSEELRQINEELEERTKELERQQNEVNEKNSELEKAKAVVQAKAEELELASKYKSEFLANMSHELRTPLNSLLILAQMLADNKKGNLEEKQVEYARTIYQSGADLLNLINDILDLSKVEAGRIEIQPEDLKLEHILTSLDQKFRHMAEQKGLAFHMNLAGNLPATVRMDEQRVRQILTNLLGNAFKFTHDGSITLDISRPEAGTDLSRSGLAPGQAIAFSVSDTGIGIAREKQKVIFEAFQQADGSVNRKYGGTGLGLSISRQLVNLLGGEIQLHSEPGKGSRFTVYLPERMRGGEHETEPARRPSPQPLSPGERGFSSPLPPGEGPGVRAKEEEKAPPAEDDRDTLKTGDKSILIVEDDRTFSNILLELGREKGFRCLLAEDGRAGLELAEKYQPSAIILDLGLPLVDGWTVMERLKENPQTRHIPVHFVSGADYSIDARRMGAIGYSLKPVSMAELGDAFRKIENFVSKAVKNLLIVTDNPTRQQAIEELVKGMDAAPTLAYSRATAWKELNLKTFDCLVLDVDTEQGKGAELLEQLHQASGLSQTPVVIYAERELTEQEHALIQKCTANVTIKEAHSSERLLDEASLFLHQVESKLPKDKQKLLRKAREKEGVLEGKKVLLVDDDARNVFALTAALEEKGMEVLAASNGKEALKVLDQHPETDVVLMDIMMPEMDGYEATRRIRGKQTYSKLPIIALTAKAMKGDKAKCIEAGANDYLPKPVEPARLLSLLRVWLSR